MGRCVLEPEADDLGLGKGELGFGVVDIVYTVGVEERALCVAIGC
jgi:hypothetical protein